MNRKPSRAVAWRAANNHRGGASERGIALILVLWLLLLSTVIAMNHARIIRTETRLAANQVKLSSARALAETGAYLAIMQLFVRDTTQRWPVDGTVQRVGLDGGDVAISIRDARGLIDLNTAQPALLKTLLGAAGLDETRLAALVDATLDWRDSDSVKHLHGAEDDDYRSAGMRWGVRDGPFASVEEYRYVMGMSNQLFDRLAPYLTVHSGHNSVEPAYAPAWLASVLAAPELNAARRTARGRADTGTRGGVYRISVWATGKGGSAASLDMVVRTTPTGRQPYTILSWRAPARLIGASFG